MLARIRKAVTGAIVAGGGTGIAWLGKAALDGSVNGDDLGQAIAARTINGSDPDRGSYVSR